MPCFQVNTPSINENEDIWRFVFTLQVANSSYITDSSEALFLLFFFTHLLRLFIRIQRRLLQDVSQRL
jgi:hypothetical protein